jgi:hypothetical protein
MPRGTFRDLLETFLVQSTLPSQRTVALPFDRVREWIVWLWFASSFVVKIEPAPTDALFFLAFGLFAVTRIRIPAPLVLIAGLLLIYNLGGFLSMIPVKDLPKTNQFVITSVYMAVSALFICAILTEETNRRLRVIFNGWIVGAVIASLLAITGFFTQSDYLLVAGRATGLFKDPNVLSTYLNLPAILLIQRLLLNDTRSKIVTLGMLMAILAALFLSFSRGAWASQLFSITLLFALTYLLSGSDTVRLKVVSAIIGGGICLGLMLAVLLSIPEVRALFIERASLQQSYDVGETGRFGSQLRSVPLLLQRPLGFGPLQYASYMGQDPHNTFLNAFASYGWLGGITYLAMIILTLAVGLRTAFTRSPWQAASIAVFASSSALILQGIQIDTDHWRHFYWLLGLTWGLFSATLIYSRRAANEPRTL